MADEKQQKRKLNQTGNTYRCFGCGVAEKVGQYTVKIGSSLALYRQCVTHGFHSQSSTLSADWLCLRKPIKILQSLTDINLQPSDKKHPRQQVVLRSVRRIAVALVLIAAVAAGGYFFWT